MLKFPAGYSVEKIDGYIVVKRKGEIICDAIECENGRLRDIRFAYGEYYKNNKIRQSAMKAYNIAGYK